MSTTAIATIDRSDATALAHPTFSADAAIEVHREIQRFIKAIMQPEHLWPRIDGRPYPPAEEILKLWSPLGCEQEFLSVNEFGSPGVHRHHVGEDARGNPVYEFTCTIKVTSHRLRSVVVVEADLSSDEFAKRKVTTTFLRQQCATRARKTALRILAGFDVDRGEGEKAARRGEEREAMDGRALLDRAVKAGVIPEPDRELLIAWAHQSVRGCEDLTPTSRVTVKHAQKMIAHLERMGG